jgi:hypothetical protein
MDTADAFDGEGCTVRSVIICDFLRIVKVKVFLHKLDVALGIPGG